ncbi:unnamed protein product [Schistosoma rodhaini]|uniref:KASH domain-containing protein n=1 Tax=Schistosoma rodhaini TaxID=6188 RepID=A0AA85FKY6_9TREM|nr:unnamed protein product [Schistosoma rodhaini]
MSKRRRRDLDLSSSSGSSDCIYDSLLWKFVDENYEFLINDDFLEHCKHAVRDEKSTTPADSSFESCIVLLEDLKGHGNFQKYLETTLTNEIQHYERRKHGIINSILSTLDKSHSPLPSSELRNFPIASDLISNELDKKSSNLLRILGELQQEWDETIRKITPISPFTNQISFLEDIDSDLKKIDAWLNTLASNLPNTSAWMTCLMSLSNVQKFSTAKYYQVCLKQIEQYSKTLSTIKELVDHVELNTLADIQFQNNLHNLSRSVCELEAKFHTLWLRLLELSIYIDQNIKTNVNKRVTTDICHDACSNKTRHDVLHQNYGNSYLSEFNTKEIGIHHVSHQNGHESGFESEQSPPLKSYYSYSCNNTTTGSDTFVVKDELRLRKDNSRSLPDDFNEIIGKLDNALLNDELKKYPEMIYIDESVKCLSSQSDLFFKNEDKCKINRYGKNLFSSSEQQDIKRNYRLEMTESGDFLWNNTGNGLIDATIRDNDSQSSNSKSAAGSTSCHEDAGVWRKRFSTEFCNLDKVENYETIHNCWSLPNAKSFVTGINKSKSIDLPLISNCRQVNDRSCSMHVNIMNNNNNIFRKIISGQKSLTTKYNNLHNFYYLKRIGNSRLMGHLLEFKVKHTNTKLRNKKNFKSRLKRTSKNRNCMSSISLNLYNQISNEMLSHTKSVVSQYSSVDTQMFHVDSGSNSDCEVTSNHSYYCKSIPDNTSELEQRQWRMQVRTYLNAAEKAEELIRNRYSPNRFESWLAGLEASNLKLGQDNDDNNNLVDLTNKQLLVKKNQNNNAYDSCSLFMNDLDEKDEKRTCQDDNDLSPLEDSHEPLLNFWDDYQASLYSNSSDSQAYEPPSMYAEEFPWDDVESPLFTDIERELNSPPLYSHKEPKKFMKSNSSSIIEENDCSKNQGQDTNDILSTSTSGLFNRKSSLDASFEIFNNTSINNTHGTESWSAEHTDNLLSPESSVRGLRTCPDGGSQHLPSIDTMDVISNQHEIQDIKNHLYPMSSFNEHLNSSNYTYYTRHHSKLHSKLYERKYQTIPRIINRKRKAQINSFQSEKQSVKREFLSLDASLNRLDNRYYSDIHKGILEHSGTRLMHAETYLQHLINLVKRNSSVQRRNLSKQVNSSNWRHRTDLLLQTAEAHVKLLSNLLDDLKSYCSSNVSELSDDRLSASFIQDLTPCEDDNNYVKTDNADDGHHHSPYRLIILNALKLKSQWINFSSTVRHIYQQSNQYEALKKQLYILQLRMHDLSKLTRQIGLSMYTSKEVNSVNPSNVDTQHISDSIIFDENQSDKLTCGFKRCFLEVDSLNFALEEIQNELNKENCQMSVNNNNSSATICNTISLDGKLLHEIDRLSSQLAINRSILQRLIRLFESSHSNNSLPHHQLDNEYLTDSIENQLETSIVNPDKSTLEQQINEVYTNEHLFERKSVENHDHQQHPVGVSTSTTEKTPSIYSSICNLLHRIFPSTNSQNYFILLISGFIFLAYLSYYILGRLLACNNYSRRPPSSTTFSSLRCFFSLNNNNSDDNNNDNVQGATTFGRCPLERDRLSNIIDYTNGAQPY